MRQFILAAFLLLGSAALFCPSSALAYNEFSGDNNCNQCHTGFDGYGAATHQMHIASFDCNACHISNGDNSLISTCAVCHDSNLLWNYHLQFAGDDELGLTCNSCHAVTPNGDNSWDAVKSWYRGARVGR